jgi:acetylornithine/N-succinyldiaminopimelate aminotransferase
VGACLATAKAAKGLSAGAHGSTFGGNPLAMAVAETVLDVMLEPGFLAGAQDAAAKLRQGVEAVCGQFPKVIEQVRGVGMLIGLKCVIPNTELIAALLANGLLTIGAGDNVVRLLPSLIIREAEIEEALDILKRTLSEVNK